MLNPKQKIFKGKWVFPQKPHPTITSRLSSEDFEFFGDAEGDNENINMKAAN